MSLRATLVVALAACAASPVLAQSEAPPERLCEREDLAPVLAGLKKARRVAGSAVGRGAQPGLFAVTARALLETKPSVEQLAELLKHEAVTIRLLGMYCLAQAHPEHAPALLDAHLEATTKVEFQPGGCSVRSAREGQLAALFLLDANALGLGKPKPIVKVPLAKPAKHAERYRWALRALAAESYRLMVGSNATGFAGTPSRFYVLACELARTGSAKQLRALLNHRDPIVRAAGAFWATQRATVDPLKPLLASKVSYQLILGCGVERVTEGEFVRRLIAKPVMLGPCPEREPERQRQR